MADFKRYFSSTSWLFLEKILSIFSSLIVGAYVARTFGPHDFGSYSYYVLIYGILLPISKFGVDSTYYIELMKDRTKFNELFTNAFFARLIVSVVIFLLSFVYVIIFSRDYHLLIVSVSVVLSFTTIVDVTQQVKVNSDIVAKCRIFQLTVSSLIKLYIAFSGLHYYYLVYVLLFDAVVILSLYYLFILRGNVNIGVFDFSSIGKLYRVSFFVFLSSICTVLYARIDSLMIYNLLGNEQLGIYSVAVRLSESWLFIPMILSSSLFPAVYEYVNNNDGSYEGKLEDLYSIISILGASAVLGAFIFSDFFVGMLFGEGFSESSDVLKIRIIETMIASVGIVANKWVISEGFQKSNFIFVLIGLLVNVVLNALFIPIFGVKGAAYASVIAILMTVIISPCFVKEFRKDVMRRIRSILIFPFIFRKLRRVF
ncbi:flippase [Vibrio brasiliensis]